MSKSQDRSQDRIYPLVPAIYRQKDIALGRPLQALCRVLDIEYEHMQEDIAGLYEQWFIETCAQWVVPYIGDLVGIDGIDTAVANVATQRTRVANTLGYRSRRGIASILANASADASGWPALPVEYFRRVITTADVGAVDLLASRSGALATASCNIADPGSLAYLDGPFSRVRRTVSVAAIDHPTAHVSGSTPECFNLPNLGIFLWRTPALPIVGTEPGQAPGGVPLTFHPLGIDTPLLRPPADRTSPWRAPSADNMPLWITRLMLGAWTDSWRAWVKLHGTDLSGSSAGLPSLGFTITVAGQTIPPQSIYVPARTAKEDKDLLRQVTPTPTDLLFAVVDPERGRFMVCTREEIPISPSSISVDWAWGQPGWIGGGPYDRESTMVLPDDGTIVILVSKSASRLGGQEKVFRDLMEVWDEISGRARELGYYAQPRDPTLDPPDVLIRILDSATYEAASFELPKGIRLTIQALEGQRPTVRAGKDGTSLLLDAPGHARVKLSGLLLAGMLDVSGEIDLTLEDMTVRPVGAPGSAAIRWSRSIDRSVTLDEPLLHLVRCITGPLLLDPPVTTSVRESILDGHGGPSVTGPDGQLGPALQLTAVSALGDVCASAIQEAQDVLVIGVVRTRSISLEVLKTALFAIELSAPAGGSGAPPIVCSRPSRIPAAPFTSTRYGDPGYGQLRLDAGDKLLRGGEGGAEMGAYRSLASGQRLANLPPVQADYTPFGLDVGIFIMGQAAMSLSTDSQAPGTRASKKGARK